MSMPLRRARRHMVLALTAIFLLAPAAFCQSPQAPGAFDSISIRPASSGDQGTTFGILPDGRIFFRNATVRQILAAAYDLDEDLVTGGPDWLDSERLNIEAMTSPSSSQTERLAMLQALLAEKFELAVRHDPRPITVYLLNVGKEGVKLQPGTTPGSHDCVRAKGDPKQIHLQCHGNGLSDLAELLPQVAPAYLDAPVKDMTGLKGSYDFQLDWMARRDFDAVTAAVAAGGPRDPMAISIFDAVAKLGLSLEKHDDQKDAIVIDYAEPSFGTDVAGNGSASSAPELKPEQVSTIDRFVAQTMKRDQIPGIAVGIYRRGHILLAKGYGLANVELNVPVRPETLFQSGSVGKQFVSAAIMMLVEEGKVGLDDSIVKYFPNAPASWKPILVKNLLSHTSGLAEYETPERAGPKGPFYLRLDFTEDELVEKVEALPIEFAPGEQWNYRNTNYLLLGILIHQVTGQPYADFLQERIFKPWYMTSTRLISEKDIIPNRSSGYELIGHKLRNQDWVSPTFNSTADGTLYFNVLDLAKWDEALYGTSMLKQSSLDRIWTVFPLNNGQPNLNNYGFGWSIRTVHGHKLVEHGGAWQGFTCAILRYVDENLTIVVLANSAQANPGFFATMIADMVNPALSPPAHKEISVDPKLFAGYVGKYQLAPDFILTISQEGNALFVQITNQPMFRLLAESERDFFLTNVDAQITFVTDAQGRATGLILHQNGDRRAKRVE